MSALDDLTPETLTETSAAAVLYDLAVLAKAKHAAEAKPGRVAMRGFCVCGYPSIGNGGTSCRALRELAEGGDNAEWLAKARALRTALTAPATDGAP